MINLILGIVIGAAFSPFWIMLWNKAKAYYAENKDK
jgi:hypothetical protein